MTGAWRGKLISMDTATTTDLDAALPLVTSAPRDVGRVELLVRRPAEDQREVVDIIGLTPETGMDGDTWATRPSSRTPDKAAHPDMQLTLMNARFVSVVAGPRERWPLAGDQVYVEFDLSHEHLPAGTRLALGDAVIEITDQPHTGCAKFTQRFGLDAMRFVNSELGLANRLRGANAKVVAPGVVRVGDAITRL